MVQNQDKLSGIVEIDETYIGGKHKELGKYDNKTSIVNMTERKGLAKAKFDYADATVANNMLTAYVEPSSTIHSDDSRIYSYVKRHFNHGVVNHRLKQYVIGEVHTNSIEGFWGQLKRSIDGTYHAVSSKHLQSYLDQFVFLYNHLAESVYPIFFERASKQV
jgi:hypothetical protein